MSLFLFFFLKWKKGLWLVWLNWVEPPIIRVRTEMEMEFQFNMCFLSKIGLLKQKLDQDNSSQRPELQLNYYYFFYKKERSKSKRRVCDRPSKRTVEDATPKMDTTNMTIKLTMTAFGWSIITNQTSSLFVASGGEQASTFPHLNFWNTLDFAWVGN